MSISSPIGILDAAREAHMNKARPLTRTVVALILMAAPAFAQPVSDHQVQVSGQKIHYLEAGSGPA